MHPDDERIARAARALRRQLSIRQEDLAQRGRSVYVTHLVESGRAGSVRVEDLRQHFSALGATVRTTVSWNGAAIDRLMDARHAVIVEALVRILRTLGWEVRTEVSFSEFGERGSIDVFAAYRKSESVFAGEVKSDWGSIEETIRIQDVKTRLAPKVAKDVFGFRPTSVGSVLVFPDESTVRRIADRHEATLGASYPARSRQVRRWVSKPSGPLRGLWFLSNPDAAAGRNSHNP